VEGGHRVDRLFCDRIQAFREREFRKSLRGIISCGDQISVVCIGPSAEGLCVYFCRTHYNAVHAVVVDLALASTERHTQNISHSVPDLSSPLHSTSPGAHSIPPAKCSIRGIILSTQNCAQAGTRCAVDGKATHTKHIPFRSRKVLPSQVLPRGQELTAAQRALPLFHVATAQHGAQSVAVRRAKTAPVRSLVRRPCPYGTATGRATLPPRAACRVRSRGVQGAPCPGACHHRFSSASPLKSQSLHAKVSTNVKRPPPRPRLDTLEKLLK